MNRSLDRIQPLVTRPDLLAFALLFVVLLLFHGPALVGSRVFLGDDTLLHSLPQAKLLSTSIAQGRLPLWTDLAFTGYPLYAEGQAGAIYVPTQVAHRVALWMGASFVTGYSLDLFAHHLALAILLFVLARQLGLSVAAGLMTALSFVFGGFVTGHLIHPNLLRTLVYLPLLLTMALRAYRMSQTPSPAEVVYSGLALGFMILAGHIQTSLIVFLCWVAWIAYLESHRPAQGHLVMGRIVPRVLPAALVGVMLAAVQIAPTAELFLQSVRSRNATWAEQTVWSTTPDRWLLALFPFLHGSGRGVAPFFAKGQFHEFACYVGAVPLLLLALVPVWRSNAGAVPFLRYLGLAGAVLALGAFSPFYPILAVPPFSLFRNPCRFFFLTELAVILLAAHAFDDLIGDHPPEGAGSRLSRFGPTRIAVALVLFLAVGWTLVACLGHNRPDLPGGPPRTRVLLDARHEFSLENLNESPTARVRLTLFNAMQGASLLAGILLVLGGIVRLRLEGEMTPAMCASWLLLVVVADVVFGFSSRVWDRGRIDEMLVETAPISHLKYAGEGRRVFVQPFESRQPLSSFVRYRFYWASAFERIASISGYTPLAPRAWADFFDNPDRPAPLDLDRSLAVLARLDPVRDLWKLRLASVSFVLSQTPVSAPDLVPWMLDGEMKLYRDQRALARAFLVRELAPLARGESENAVLRRLNQTLPAVSIQKSDGEKVICAAVETHDESTTVHSSGPEELVVLARLRARGWLVVPDLWYPGWRATVDGRDVPIRKVCGIFRAVELDRGFHEIRMTFDPPVLKQGALVTFAGLGLAFLILLVGMFERRRSEEP